VAMCLAGKFNELLVACGVVCSSWSVVNLGTSLRNLLCPYGDCTRGSVVAGNRMVARTGLDSLRFLKQNVVVKEIVRARNTQKLQHDSVFYVSVFMPTTL
jgi:hypothetical protein